MSSWRGRGRGGAETLAFSISVVAFFSAFATPSCLKYPIGSYR